MEKPISDARQSIRHDNNTEPPFGLLLYRLVSLCQSFIVVSAHFIMFHCVCCQSAAGHTKKKEPLPEKWSENLGVFVLLEQKLISSLVWHEKKKKKKKDKKYANVRKREDDSSLLADRETVK